MMAKLYWRVKLNGKWTWRPLIVKSEFEQKLIDNMKQRFHVEEEE